MRTWHRLAVGRHDFIRGCDSDRLHPLDESFVESRGNDQRKDPGKGIVGWDAVFQLEKGLEPIFGRLAERFQFDEVFGFTNDGEDCDDDDFIKLMRFASVASRGG